MVYNKNVRNLKTLEKLTGKNSIYSPIKNDRNRLQNQVS